MKIANLRFSEIPEPVYEWAAKIETRPEKDIWEAYNHSVYIKHIDGSELNLKNAFLVIYQNDILILSEHIGYFKFNMDDVVGFKEEQ